MTAIPRKRQLGRVVACAHIHWLKGVQKYVFVGLTAVRIHPGLLRRVTIDQVRLPGQVGQIHSQEQRVEPLNPAVQHRGHGPAGRVRSGGTAALDLRAGNEVTWAVGLVMWWSATGQGSSEGWVRPGGQSVDLERGEGWRWTAVVPVQGCAEKRRGCRHRRLNYCGSHARRLRGLQLRM